MQEPEGSNLPGLHAARESSGATGLTVERRDWSDTGQGATGLTPAKARLV